MTGSNPHVNRLNRPNPCQRCRSMGRKCSLDKPSCLRCVRKGACCIYIDQPIAETKQGPSCACCRWNKKRCDKKKPVCSRCNKYTLTCAYLLDASVTSPLLENEFDAVTFDLRKVSDRTTDKVRFFESIAHASDCSLMEEKEMEVSKVIGFSAREFTINDWILLLEFTELLTEKYPVA